MRSQPPCGEACSSYKKGSNLRTSLAWRTKTHRWWRALHKAGPRLQPPHINRCDRHTSDECCWVQATNSTIIEETGPLRLCWRVIGISVHSWAVLSRRTWFPFLYLVLLLVLPLCLTTCWLEVQWRDMSWFHGHAERTTLVRILVGLSRKLARLATKMRRGTFELAELLHCPHCGCTRSGAD